MNILHLVRSNMIKRLNKKKWGKQRINTVLKAMDLPGMGVPKMKNPPKRPSKKIIAYIKVTPEMLEDFKI